MHANLHINAISRSGGRSAVGASAYRSASAVACAAYRSGDKIQDERYEKTHDYSKKQNVLHAEIIIPEGAPEWMTDREKLWNHIEKIEKRKDAQLAKEIVLVLPRNLDTEQHKEVIRHFVRDNLTARGLVADFAIHSPQASDGGRNPHAHIMFGLRPVEGDGFGKKLTGYRGGLDSREVLGEFRSSYEMILNHASDKAGSEIYFDLRNLKEKCIDREPQRKIGPVKQSEWGKAVRHAQHQSNAQAAYSRHTASYQLIGGGSKQPAYFIESMRADVAQKYHEVVYGDQLHKDFYGNDERERGVER